MKQDDMSTSESLTDQSVLELDVLQVMRSNLPYTDHKPISTTARKARQDRPGQQRRADTEQHLYASLLYQLVLAQATHLARAGYYAEAEQLLAEHSVEEIPGAYPAILPTLDLRARICAQQERFDEAEHYWKQALELDSMNKDARAGLRRIKERRNRSSNWPLTAYKS